MLAPDKGLATLPISIYVLGMWMGTLPMGWLARIYGRRTALQIGTVSGILTGLICCVAVLQGSFLLFNIGAIFSGFYAAAHQSYRFAATDTASDAFKAEGDLLGDGRRHLRRGSFGPQLVIATKDIWQPYLFAASYIAQSAFALVCGRRADAAEDPDAAAARPRQARGDRWPKSRASRASSWRSPAGSPAIR